MTLRHSWDLTPPQAVRLQEELAPLLQIGGSPRLRLVAGVDLAYEKSRKLGFCAVVVLRYPDLEVVERVFDHDTVLFPYVPGLLTFREGPLILKTMRLLRSSPSLLLFDGQGIAHPRRMGVAAHLGLYLDLPSLGVAKSRLYGEYREPAREKGSLSPLLSPEGERVGTVLRTRTGVKPVFVSPGHRIGLEEATETALRCATRYRIPEPTRLADLEVERYKRSVLASLEKSGNGKSP